MLVGLAVNFHQSTHLLTCANMYGKYKQALQITDNVKPAELRLGIFDLRGEGAKA